VNILHFFGMTLVLSSASLPAFAAPCESLSALKLADTTIVSAHTVNTGEATVPELKNAPPFCHVVMEIKPSADSQIKVEVVMPLTGWNGRFQGTGNGGFGGSITYIALAGALRRGYAAAGTDTGHTGAPPDGSWALKHPERITDFGYRAIHEMTVKATTVVAAFYGEKAAHSYFVGCSNGGRQALMEAQRYPGDYDGILAGAPANYWTHLVSAGVWNMQATESDLAGYIPAAKIPALSAAVQSACDAQDGLKDGLVSDPPACKFDPAVLLCKEADANTCLTAPQVAALKKIYSGPHDSKGHALFPGFSPGGEEGQGGWATWLSGTAPGTSLQMQFGRGFFANMVFNDPAWDFKTLNFDTGVKLADDKLAATLNATDPSLKTFERRGGKLILYHGWSDIAIPPANTVDYYQSVLASMGAKDAARFIRLFMAPGMQHCLGGPGPNSFNQFGTRPKGDAQHDALTALEEWVEKGAAPEKIIATKYSNDLNPAASPQMTRPLCPFPQIAKYKGSGDANDAANFVCADQPKPAARK
jgi:hypothetical protein